LLYKAPVSPSTGVLGSSARLAVAVHGAELAIHDMKRRSVGIGRGRSISREDWSNFPVFEHRHTAAHISATAESQNR